MKKGILFLNGEPPAAMHLQAVQKAKQADAALGVYCTDGAYRYVSPYLLPDTVLGDFDSLPLSAVHPSCEKAVYPADKDYTDGFLAVKVMLSRGYDHIDIYGAYGGRPDMAQSNFALLALARAHGIRARFCGDMQTYLIGETFTLPVRRGATVSLVPFTDTVHIVYTKGLKYALHDHTMRAYADLDAPDYIMGVSNEGCGTEAEVRIDKGLALLFVQQ